MLCSYLCGIVRILVKNLIQINGFFLSLPPPQIPPPWPRTIVLYSDSASYRIWGMHFFLTFDLNEARFDYVSRSLCTPMSCITPDEIELIHGTL